MGNNYLTHIEDMRFLSVGINSIKEELFEPIKNIEYMNKPHGGLWSSPYYENGEYKSDWLRFCIEEDFNTENIKFGVLFNLKPDSKVYVIDNMDDLENLYGQYKGKDTNSILYKKSLDFEKIALDYDAIYLTDKGQWETRFPKSPISLGSLSLYGWDVETLLVLNLYCIKDFQLIDL